MPSVAVEVEAPDISAYRHGNAGVDYVETIDSGRSGPHVMVSGIVHGNELCGAIVLDWLHRMAVRPLLGKLTLVFANVAAYERFDPGNPYASRFVDEDMNRVWSAPVLDGERESVELSRARALREIVCGVDLLLDLHSMYRCETPLTLCGPLDKGRELALLLGTPAHVVADAGHVAGVRLRDYAGFADPGSARNALLVECGLHWARETVAVARDATLRFLHQAGLVDVALVEEHGRALPGAQRVIEVVRPVTIATDRFRFVRAFDGMEVIPKAGTVIAHDGDEAVTTPFDDCVLIMPSTLKRRGESAVRLGRIL